MRRTEQPTLVFLPGESPWTEEPEGLQKSLGGYSPWGHKESDTTEQPSTAQSDTKPLFLGVYLKQEPV